MPSRPPGERGHNFSVKSASENRREGSRVAGISAVSVAPEKVTALASIVVDTPLIRSREVMADQFKLPVTLRPAVEIAA